MLYLRPLIRFGCWVIKILKPFKPKLFLIPIPKFRDISFHIIKRDIMFFHNSNMKNIKIVKIKMRGITTAVYLLLTRLASNSFPRMTKDRTNHSEGLEKIRQECNGIDLYWWTPHTNRSKYNRMYHRPQLWFSLASLFIFHRIIFTPISIQEYRMVDVDSEKR